MRFSVKRKEFCQRLVAAAEGLFAAVCLITRPARRRFNVEKIYKLQIKSG